MTLLLLTFVAVLFGDLSVELSPFRFVAVLTIPHPPRSATEMIIFIHQKGRNTYEEKKYSNYKITLTIGNREHIKHTLGIRQ